MSKPAFFQIDTRLTSLLGETYRSTEFAIKELVDNAWDADAENIEITLPDAMSTDPIIIQDDGFGMTEQDVRNEYLKIARDRRSSKGEETHLKKRAVKGRKGIGKFAGLMAADEMKIETFCNGLMTKLVITKKALLETSANLDSIQLPIEMKQVNKKEHGTTITLSNLSQQLSFPDISKLKRILVLEYGREEGLQIRVNGRQVILDDLPGTHFSETIKDKHAGSLQLNYVISEDKKTSKYAGISLRVGNKLVGKPHFFGLDEDEEIPTKLLTRVCGEVQANELVDYVTADWSGMVENSRGYQFLSDWVRSTIKEQLEHTFRREVGLLKAKLGKEYQLRIENLPEHRRQTAERMLEKVMGKLFQESPERIGPVINVILDVFEHDEYWQVVSKINESRHGDVEVFAEALQAFGLLEMSLICQQAVHRLEFLDKLDELIKNPLTLEQTMHKALENNLWVLDPSYSMLASNKSLSSILEQYCNTKFKGKRANKRPDLLLSHSMQGKYILIEFKRPSHKIIRDDENQAENYRDDLQEQFQPIEIILIGHSIDKSLHLHQPPQIQHFSYAALISKARNELAWLIKELSSK